MPKSMYLKSVAVLLTLSAISLAAEQNPTPQTKFTATLASGVIVELVGVTDYPSKNQPLWQADRVLLLPPSWWQADGVLLTELPYDGSSIDISSTGNPDIQKIELALRLRGTADDPAWEASVKRSDGNAVLWGGRRMKNGQFVRDIKSIVIMVPSKQQTLDLSLGIAAGQWHTIDAYCPDIISTNIVTDRDDGAISWTKPVEKDGMTILEVSHTYTNENVRIAVIDANNNLRAANSTFPIGAKTVQANFHPPLSGVKQFVFQTRPYEWVEFKNISLRPGQKTKVETQITGNNLSDPNQQPVSALNSQSKIGNPKSKIDAPNSLPAGQKK
jgi:hypothetical protein